MTRSHFRDLPSGEIISALLDDDVRPLAFLLHLGVHIPNPVESNSTNGHFLIVESIMATSLPIMATSLQPKVLLFNLPVHDGPRSTKAASKFCLSAAIVKDPPYVGGTFI